MWDVIAFAVLLIPAIVVLMVLRDLGDEAMDSAAARIRNNPAVAKRAKFYRPLWKTGGLLVVLAVMPVGICVKGATADQWRTAFEISAGLLAAGSLLLGLWWALASRKVANEVAQA